jgi:multiple sugar transport system ATP-binding protein
LAKVVLDKVYKRFGENTVVKNVNLEIRDGEFLILVGPSGCGKTTTLRMIAGLEDPSEGNIFIGDRLVNDVAAKDRDIAMVFQSYALYPHMSVYKNMAFALKLKKVPADEIDKRVKETASLLGIEDLLNRQPKQLSGGQRQRVALGRAIVRHPAVFLMDEPLSNLDAKLRVQMRSELIRLHQNLKTTIIYVTHDQTEAMTMGTRIVVMKDGIIQQIGTPTEIYNQPKNQFVAGFIGSPSMNFIKGEIIQSNGNLIFINEGMKINLSKCKNVDKVLKDKKYILGIRPEDLQINEEKAESQINSKVDVYEHFGAEYVIHTKLVDNQKVIFKMPASLKVPSIGAFVKLTCDSEKIHLFDEETGEAIF